MLKLSKLNKKIDALTNYIVNERNDLINGNKDLSEKNLEIIKIFKNMKKIYDEREKDFGIVSATLEKYKKLIDELKLKQTESEERIFMLKKKIKRLKKRIRTLKKIKVIKNVSTEDIDNIVSKGYKKFKKNKVLKNSDKVIKKTIEENKKLFNLLPDLAKTQEISLSKPVSTKNKIGGLLKDVDLPGTGMGALRVGV